MLFLKSITKKLLPNFAYFYSHLRYRIFVILALSIFVGIMDGFGLAMFLPLLEFVAGDGTGGSENMGNLAFLVDALESLNLSLNLTLVLLTMLAFFSLKGIFKFLEQYKSVIYHQFFIQKVREENIRALADFRYDIFVDSDAGKIQNTLSGEIQRASAALKHYLLVIQTSMLVTVYTVLAFLSNAEFAMLVVIGGVLTNFAFNRLYSATKRLSRKLTKSNHSFQGLLIQQVAFFKYLKATGLVKSYAKKLVSMVREIENSQRRIGVLGALMTGVREPVMIGVVVVVILIQVNWMGASLGLILLSILFFYRALGSVMSLQKSWNSFLSTVGSVENLNEFTAELKLNKERDGKQSFQRFESSIALEKVSFSYGVRDVIKDIDLRIGKNETIAFVGESGSGKTTLMNLLSGILTPTQGKILVDGLPLTNLKKEEYQNRIGYITQDPVIFSDSIFNNVTFWAEKSEENLTRFKEACRQAHILTFIEELPTKEESLLGNNGINLSGGQKQRISIARELYKEVDFLFLDEATSALDSETEKEIQMNIERLKGQYTIVVIAHRLSTIKNADRVVVLNEGEIERVGSYQQLIGESDAFKRMVELQEV